MNRRSFFRSLALIGAAVSASPHIFIPKFEPVKWKVVAPPRRLGWFIAEFKAAIAPDYSGYNSMIFHKREPLVESAPNPDWEPAPMVISGYGDERFISQFKPDAWKFSFEPIGEVV